jgi:amino-acid N-acetyltransferase
MQVSTTIRVERANEGDAPAILQLLSDSALPTDGLLDHLGTAVVARREDGIIGCAALEVYPEGALLRSVAVAEDTKRRGLGTQLTNSALDLAATLGLRTIYLLTTTAEEFFPRFGFERITREQVPATVQASIEFRSACPASAIVMRKVRPAVPDPLGVSAPQGPIAKIRTR